MANWSGEAQAALADYLSKVEAVAAQRGADGGAEVTRVRERIEKAASAAGDKEQDLDALRRILSVVGTPVQAVAASTGSPPPVPGAHININIQPAPSRSRGVPCVLWGAIGAGCLVMFIVVALVLAAILLPALARAREAARRASCANNLKQIGLVTKTFASEHQNSLPPLADELGKWAPDANTIFGEYVTDPSIFACPSDDSIPADVTTAAAIDDHSYFYLGHLVRNEAEMVSYVETVRATLARGETLAQDLTAEDGTVFPRLTDLGGAGMAKPSTIVVAFDRLGNHVPAGANVLFLDGHVGYIKQGLGQFPVTQGVYDALASAER